MSKDEKNGPRSEREVDNVEPVPQEDNNWTFKEAATLILLGLPVSLWLVFAVLLIAALAISLTRGVVVAPLLEYLFGA